MKRGRGTFRGDMRGVKGTRKLFKKSWALKNKTMIGECF
jgi:hypothetical protein